MYIKYCGVLAIHTLKCDLKSHTHILAHARLSRAHVFINKYNREKAR